MLVTAAASYSACLPAWLPFASLLYLMAGSEFCAQSTFKSSSCHRTVTGSLSCELCFALAVYSTHEEQECSNCLRLFASACLWSFTCVQFSLSLSPLLVSARPEARSALPLSASLSLLASSSSSEERGAMPAVYLLNKRYKKEAKRERERDFT